jgi:uncharacterized protein YcfJ
MNAFPKSALTLAALTFSSLAAAQVTFYEQENFAGRSFTTQNRVANFARFGFNDRASSVDVASSRWEACEDTRFGGRCVVLRPGSYPSLASMGLGDRVSSVRKLPANANIQDSRYAPAPAAAQVTFFENEGLRGQSFTSAALVSDFRRSGFNDRASSVEVVGYRWEACEDARFEGRCVVLRPGRYDSLRSMGLDNQVTSVRPLRWSQEVAENRYAPMPGSERSAQERQERRDFRRRNNERTYEANVTSARAVVGTPEQRCWVEREQVSQPQSGINIPGTIVGAVVGGILGHQVGSGTGQDIATLGGAAAGGYVGNKIGQSQTQTRMQDVQRCANVPNTQAPTYWDVTYNFRGQDHRVQMTSQPGATVTVNEQGEPRT